VRWRQSFCRFLHNAGMLPLADARTLFDACPDVVFFGKDAEGRYTHGNRTLLQRLGLDDENELIGRDAVALFPTPLGASYHAQDRRVLDSGQPLLDELELHLFPNHAPGWCLTRKLPLLDGGGRVVGLVGISRDLPLSARAQSVTRRLRRVIEHVQAHPGEPHRIAALAGMAQLSLAQFERQFQRLLQVSPKAWLTSVRLDAAMQALAGSDTGVAEVAQQCGFADQSAFARSFRKHVGLTPTQFRAARRGR
jgi:AraC-like DNA-binding protein